MKKVLIFRIGSLGDTLVALPAMWRVREHFRGAEIHLLCDRQLASKYVLASDLLKGSGVVDEFHSYPVAASGIQKILQPLHRLALAAKLRVRRFDTVVYLAPSARRANQIRRDRFFFGLCGIREFIGFKDLNPELPSCDKPMATWPREADLLERRIEGSIAPATRRRFDLGICDTDRMAMRSWASGKIGDGGRPWIAIAPGSKMPSKIWPIDRFISTVQKLIDVFDIWPVVFGDRSENALAERCVANWGRGFVAAGHLNLRPAIAALELCRLYLGNDTGTMHMAASAGVPCVTIFCSHAPPGQWYPLGEGHRALRTAIDCEGCRLTVCVNRKMECIMSVQESEVLRACREVLDTSLFTQQRLPVPGLALPTDLST